jgi:hypothetical protein
MTCYSEKRMISTIAYWFHGQLAQKILNGIYCALGFIGTEKKSASMVTVEGPLSCFGLVWVQLGNKISPYVHSLPQKCQAFM